MFWKTVSAIIVILIAGSTLFAEIIEVGNIDTPGDATDVVVRGDYAYIADGPSGLRIVNISNPEEPENTGSLDTDGSTLALAVEGDLAYLADGMRGLVIVDISNPEEPQAIGEFSAGMSIINDVTVSGDYAYLTDLINGMRITNVADPENPEQVSLYEQSEDSRGIFISGDYAYIASGENGLQIVDISNPEEPDSVGTYDTRGEAMDVIVEDDLAYVAFGDYGLVIVRISSQDSPVRRGRYDTPGIANSVFVNGVSAYVADGGNGLQMINVSDQMRLELIGEFDTEGTSNGVTFADGYIYIADGESGLRILAGTPEIVVSDEELDFGEVDVNESEELTLTITNEGHADLIISDISIDNRYFRCDFEEELTIGIGEEYELTVTFSPEWFGNSEGKLTISSNDTQNRELFINLSGYVDPDFDEQKINANDAAYQDFFGYSVSISGDYAVVGAHRNDDDGDDTGCAYIFVRDGDEWTEQTKLTADDAEDGDWFGYSVSISGDYAIVGAIKDDDDGEDSGSAYIFVRDGDEWIEQAKLTADDAEHGDNFGISVSISVNYAIIGTNNSAAYIFSRRGEEWTQQEKVRRWNKLSVSIDGDYAIIGAYDYLGGPGLADIFVRDGEDWTRQATLRADDGEYGDGFGHSVSINGDYALIGAYENDDDGENSGSAYIFVRDGDEWIEQAKLTAKDADAGDNFGNSVSLRGRFAVIGAWCNEDGGDYSGSAYIFLRQGDDWTELTKLISYDLADHDLFGYSTYISRGNVIIGAYGNRDAGHLSGSAYIYSIVLPEQPAIRVSPDGLDFEEILTGSDSDLEFSISNNGEGDLQITDISAEGEGFDVNFEEQLVIEPDASEEITVTFSPEVARAYNAELQISSNDPFNEVTTIELTGTGISAMTIPFNEGWNLISINVSPGEEFYREGEDRGPEPIRMMEQLRIDEDNHHLILMKDEVGRFYLPDYGYCNIPYWNLTEGYQVKVDEDCEANWVGEQIPFDTDIPITEGWNIIAYYPTYELDASDPDFYVLSPIIDHVIIAKDIQGRFINPEWGYSNMPPWRQTQGYKIKVDEDVTLNYPEQQEERLACASSTPPYPPLETRGGDQMVHAVTLPLETRAGDHMVHTDKNMSLLVNSISGIESESDLRIQAFNSDGLEVGFGTIDEKGQCGLAIWGDDESTDIVEGLREGEAFELKLVSASSETPLSVQTIKAGNGLVYTTNDFTVLEMSASSAIPEDYLLSQNYPNPFNSITRLNYGLPEAGLVNISVFDIEGRLVETLVRLDQVAGYHYVTWDANIASSGLYFIEMKAEGFTQVQKIVLTK